MRYVESGSWYEGLYPDKAPVIPAARSFSCIHDGGARSCVLLVHGYAGYPGELVSPALALYQAGFDCHVPRLPGMGTSGEDFINTSSDDWLGLVDHALADLERRYERVFLLGHSMGCLLCVIAQTGGRCDGMVLAMPAFSIPSLDGDAMSELSRHRKDVPASWSQDLRYHLHYENAPCDDPALGREYYSHVYPAQLYQMSLLSTRARATMEHLTVPTLILASHSDAVVDGDACARYADVAHVVYIEGATHFVFYDIDPGCERRALDETVSFLSRLG